ncbi:hypothetical protein APC1476_1657 [Bifidobacterium longum]|nr:hypothetical protein APC1476_1657 [Bifidobacterium longum]
MLIPSNRNAYPAYETSLSRRVNANSQHTGGRQRVAGKLIKKGEC